MTYTRSAVISNEKLSDGIYELKLRNDFGEVNPGQFFMFAPPGVFLPRPLSVCSSNPDTLRFAYQVTGKGTRELSRLRGGDFIELFGALGNGFPVDEIRGFERVALVSGGIGTAPLVGLAERLKGSEIRSFAGFSESAYLTDELPNVTVSIGGFVTDLFDPADFGAVIACGNEGFSRAVIAKCRGKTRLYISMDRHMACGVGACLVCSCETKYGYRRCCADGPVFTGEDFPE